MLIIQKGNKNIIPVYAAIKTDRGTATYYLVSNSKLSKDFARGGSAPSVASLVNSGWTVEYIRSDFDPETNTGYGEDYYYLEDVAVKEIIEEGRITNHSVAKTLLKKEASL